MLRVVLLLLCLAVSTPALAAQRTVLVLGDSLSAAYGIDRDQGWVSRLEQRLGGSATVVNASVSGDTTRGGLARLPGALEAHHPDIVIIELGGNDGLRGVPVATTRRNLSRMVELSQQAGAQVLLVGVRLPANYGAAFIERFQGVFREVAKSQNVPLVPKLLDGVGGRPQLMQGDGIHPNAQAQPRLLDNIWPKLEALLSGT